MNPLVMKTIVNKWGDAINMGWTYVFISRKSLSNAPLFSNVETYCLFIGYPRSGHSILGALLDAHPNAVIAHELGDLKYIHARFDRLRLYHLLLQNASASADTRRRSGQYVYHVPRQWQGRFDCIRVIGDKQGEGTTLRLAERPWLLQALRDTVRVPVKFVHVIRNPFDNIATMAIRAANGGTPDLKACIGRYFNLCDTVMQIKEQVNEADVVEFTHEMLVEDPIVILRRLCLSLGLVPSNEYLNACSEIVYKSPHKSRHKLQWTSGLRREVEESMKRFSFLGGYTFEG